MLKVFVRLAWLMVRLTASNPLMLARNLQKRHTEHNVCRYCWQVCRLCSPFKHGEFYAVAYVKWERGARLRQQDEWRAKKLFAAVELANRRTPILQLLANMSKFAWTAQLNSP